MECAPGTGPSVTAEMQPAHIWPLRGRDPISLRRQGPLVHWRAHPGACREVRNKPRGEEHWGLRPGRVITWSLLTSPPQLSCFLPPWHRRFLRLPGAWLQQQHPP